GGGGSRGQGERGGRGSLAHSRQIGASHLADGPDPPPTPVGHCGFGKGSGGFREIGLLEPVWKLIEAIMDRRLNCLELHDCRHG
ncbi:hypothetical protein ACHAWF_007301, partial [Thalassiosira exigua]